MISHGKMKEKYREIARNNTQSEPDQLDTIMSINSMGFSPTTVFSGKERD